MRMRVRASCCSIPTTSSKRQTTMNPNRRPSGQHRQQLQQPFLSPSPGLVPQATGWQCQDSFSAYRLVPRMTSPAAPSVSWKLTRDEQMNYDQIFRAWDQGGTGFIGEQMGLEAFGQSGLPREDLAKIWCVFDISRGPSANSLF
jgi:hypothetical protein